MKFTKLMTAALAATVMFSSCSNDDDVKGGSGSTGQETFAGFYITIPAPTNVRGVDDATAATAAESIVNSLAVYVVDNTDQSVHSVYMNNEGTDFEDNLDGTYSAKVAIRTTTGSKTVYGIANPPAALKTVIDNMGAAAFSNNAIALAEASFMQTSGGNLTDMVMSGSAAASLGVTTESDALQDANLIAIDITRNLSKVVVRNAPSVTVIGGTHEAGSLQFGLIAKANSAYLVSQSATATALTGVPTDAMGDGTHAYWTKFSALTLGDVAANYKLVNAYSSDADAYTKYNGWYCHENILGKSDFLNNDGIEELEIFAGNTTAARIRGKFIPADLVNAYDATTADRTITNPSTAATFYRHKTENSYWSAAAYAAATATSTDAGYIAPPMFTAAYTDGWGYYRINVMSDTRVPGVKRNSYYDMAIETINGPGNPTEIPTDPPILIEEESYIAVKVTVKPWVRETTGHTIQ